LKTACPRIVEAEVAILQDAKRQSQSLISRQVLALSSSQHHNFPENLLSVMKPVLADRLFMVIYAKLVLLT
jgi:hypothetical protein